MLLLYFLLHINPYLNKHILYLSKIILLSLAAFYLFLFSVPKKKKRNLTYPSLTLDFCHEGEFVGKSLPFWEPSAR